MCGHPVCAVRGRSNSNCAGAWALPLCTSRDSSAALPLGAAACISKGAFLHWAMQLQISALRSRVGRRRTDRRLVFGGRARQIWIFRGRPWYFLGLSGGFQFGRSRGSLGHQKQSIRLETHTTCCQFDIEHIYKCFSSRSGDRDPLAALSADFGVSLTAS